MPRMKAFWVFKRDRAAWFGIIMVDLKKRDGVWVEGFRTQKQKRRGCSTQGAAWVKLKKREYSQDSKRKAALRDQNRLV